MVPDQPRFFPFQTPNGVKVTVEPNLGRRLADLPPVQLDDVPSHPDPFLRALFNKRGYLNANSPEGLLPITSDWLSLDLRGPIGRIKYGSKVSFPVIAISITRRKLGFIMQGARTLLWLELAISRGGHVVEGHVRDYPRYCLPGDVPLFRRGDPRRFAMNVSATNPQRTLVSTAPPSYEQNQDPKATSAQH